MARIDDYIAALDGWQAQVAAELRENIRGVNGITESFKWGHPIFETKDGPVCLIKAQKSHVTLGFWRGQQIEGAQKLNPTGSFKMADIKLQGTGEISGDEVRQLVASGIALNAEHGDPLKSTR